MATRQDFAQAILQAGGWPVTQSNVNFLMAWMQREGGTAANNPINTTHSAAGATNYNSVGVKNYPDMQTGVQAIVATLGGSYYGDIRTALASGDATAADRAGKLAQDFHAWSAGPNAPMSKGYTSVTSSGAFNNLAHLAQQAVSGTSNAVGSAAQDAANNQATYGDIDGFLKSQAPALAAAINDPKVHALLSQWGNGQLSDAEFQAQLEATQWWRSTPASQRTVLVEQATDPATARQALDNGAAQILSEAAKKGVAISPQQASDLATKALVNNWGFDFTAGSQLEQQIASFGKYQGDITYKGEAGTDVQQLKSLYDSYALPVSDQTLNTQLQQVLSGKVTVQDMQQGVAQQAATLYASNPQLADFLKSGQGTVKQWADPYVQKAAQLLGQNPNSIDVTAPMWAKVLQPATDPKTGASTGQAMSLDQWETMIRNQPQYGFDSSTNGIQQGAQLGGALGKILGTDGL